MCFIVVVYDVNLFMFIIVTQLDGFHKVIVLLLLSPAGYVIEEPHVTLNDISDWGKQKHVGEVK